MLGSAKIGKVRSQVGCSPIADRHPHVPGGLLRITASLDDVASQEEAAHCQAHSDRYGVPSHAALLNPRVVCRFVIAMKWLVIERPIECMISLVSTP